MSNAEINRARILLSKTGTSVFLTGKAGTGKTTFLKELKKHSPKRMIVLAPTGVAAINAEGVTIHSFFQLPLSPYLPGRTNEADTDRRMFVFSKRKREIINSIDLLVIDEISMVRADVLDAVDAALRRYRRSSAPFGGVQLLMIGDVRQLAPVVTDREREILASCYETPFFFSSKALQQIDYVTIELKTIYRQTDGDFLAMLNSIRDNCADAHTLAELNKRYIPGFTPQTDDNYIMLTALNRTAQQYNEQRLAGIDGRAFTYRATITGTFPETSLPTDMQLTLKAGAQIIFIKNDTTSHNYYNGMIGTVVALNENTVRVRSGVDGNTFNVETVEWQNIKYTLNADTQEIAEEVEGTFRQYPLKLAWAITIHKSQGLTFEKAIIDASSSFTPGQVYVALSRCKTLEGMVLRSPIRPGDIMSDQNVDRFIDGMADGGVTDEHIDRMEREYTVRLLDEMFDYSPVLHTLRQLLRLLEGAARVRNEALIGQCLEAETNIDALITVAAKFKNEYTSRAFTPQGTHTNEFAERIRRASVYFSAQTAPLHTLAFGAVPDIANKANAKRAAEHLAALRKLLFVKTEVLAHESKAETAFSVEDYLHRKARASLMLDDNGMPRTPAPAKKRRTAKAKAEKKVKIKTEQQTFDLFVAGNPMERIALLRGLAIGTIQSHMAKYVAAGKVAAAQLIPAEKLRHINAAADTFGQSPISIVELRSRLSMDFTYGEIKIALAARGITDI